MAAQIVDRHELFAARQRHEGRARAKASQPDLALTRRACQLPGGRVLQHTFHATEDVGAALFAKGSNYLEDFWLWRAGGGRRRATAPSAAPRK